ncbi:MAG: helix-turn-helix domain-containing protein [Candidatus Micrarchaeota archaeon]
MTSLNSDSLKSSKHYTTSGSIMPSISRNSDVIASLRALGLNEYEAKAYYALAASQTCTAGELATRAQLPRPRVYDVLTSLQDQGYVVLQPGRPVKYSALSIQEAMDTVKKQKRAELEKQFTHFDTVSKQMQSKIKAGSISSGVAIEENVWTLKGKDAINSKLASMLAEAKSHVVISSTQDGLQQKMKLHGQLLQAAKARGARIHIIASKMAPEVTSLAHTTSLNSLPTRFVLADDQALLFLSNDKTHADDEVGLWLKNQHVAQTLKQLITK